MKKILLTILAGFCFGTLAMAQEPSKTATKKARPSLTSDNAKAYTQEAKAKAAESGKPLPAPASAAKARKASLAADKAN